MPAVNVGILLLMKQSARIPWPLTECFTCLKGRERKIFIVIAILKVTVKKFPKVTSESASGLETVQVMPRQILTVVEFSVPYCD